MGGVGVEGRYEEGEGRGEGEGVVPLSNVLVAHQQRLYC